MKCLVFWCAGAALVAACGAPLKSASSVASLFTTNPSLQDMETTVCKDMATRTDPPSTANLGFDIQNCQRSGQGALNYTQITAFQFVNIDGTAVSAAAASPVTTPATTAATGTTATGTPGGSAATSGTAATSLALDTTTSGAGGSATVSGVTSTTSSAADGAPPVTTKSVRAEVWLNKSFLDLATTLTDYMKKNSGTGTGVITLPNSSTSGFANLATPSITLTQKPVLNISDLSFSMQIELKLTGIITVDQTIQINGKLIDNAFAIVGHTVSDQPYGTSLIKNFEMVIVVVPYANDVYLDLFVNVAIYDVGLKSIFDQQLNTFLSTGLKGIIDSLVVVGGAT